MPLVYVPWIAIGLVDQQVYTIGVATSDQSKKGCAVIAMLACEPTMCQQLEAAVIALDHNQRFPDLATVLQKKFIA
jgi:hypothetical protein